ncbi:MAG: GGDEF domain-containing protein [Bradymonadales bacterium]|nr:GGDEF domain-containing protein [Bradymonadales bacterium]
MVLPAALPLLAGWLVIRFGGGFDGWGEVVVPVVLAIYGIGMLIGWRFHRSRVVLSLVVLALSWFGTERLVVAGGGESGGGGPLLVLVGMLLPANLSLWAVLPSRGLFTWRGVGRWVLVLGQACGVWYAVQNGGVATAFWDRPVLGLPDPLSLPVPQLVLLGYLLASAVLLLALWRRRTALESGLVGALVASLVALVLPAGGEPARLFWGAAGLALTLGLVERSYSLAYRDELTGLPGRRALNEALRQQSGTYTVAMVDVDHFKRFNDRYGHDVGDQALRLVARQLSRVEGGGQPFRYGGEEFSVLFPGRSASQALTHLEHLRQAIQTASFVRRSPLRPRRKPTRLRKPRRSPRRISLTVSMGAASRAQGRDKPDQVIKAADRLLYRSKKAGRNRVSASD